MKKNKIKNKILKFSIPLVLLLLIQISFADITLNDFNAYGQNSKVNSFVAYNETVMIGFNTSLNNNYLPDNYSINISYPFLLTTAKFGFDPAIVCTKVQGTNKNISKCEFAINKKGSSQSKSENINLEIYDNENHQIKQESTSITSDNTNPTINNVDIAYDTTTTKITISYNDGSQCSKLGLIELYNQYDNLITSQTINSDTCIGNKEFTIPSSNFEKGNNTIKVKLFDKVGNFGESTKNFTVDKAPIVVDLSGGFNIIDKEGNPINYCLNSYHDTVKISFTINVQDSLNRIIADSSQIGGGSKTLDPNRDCQDLSGNLYCEFESAFSCDSSSSDDTVTKNLKVTLVDDSVYANPQEIEIPKTFQIDKINPEPTGLTNVITSPYESEITGLKSLFVGKNAKVKLYVNEQSGVNSLNSYIKMNGQNYYFQNCSFYGDGADICTISGFAISDEKCNGYENSINNNCTAQVYVEDFNGNHVMFNWSYVIDNDIPVITPNSIRLGSSTNIGFLSQFVVDQSQARFTSLVDDIPVMITLAQPSDRSKNVIGENYTKFCQYYDDSTNKYVDFDKYVSGSNYRKTCDIKFQVISDSVDKGNIELYISDFAGNTYHKTLNVTVLEHESNDSNLYTFNNPKLMQGVVTRDSASIGAQKLMFESSYQFINNGTKSDMAQAVVDQNSCQFKDSGRLLGTPKVDFVTSNKVYFNVEMKKTTRQTLEKYNSLDLTCNITVFAIKDGKKLARELETLNFIVPLGDDPQSTVGASLDAKIERAMDDSKLKLASKLAKIEKFIRQARKLCGMIGTVQKVDGMLNLNLFTQNQIAKARSSTDGGASMQEVKVKNKKETNGVHKEVHKITDKMTKFCGIFNCNKQSDSGFASALTKNKVIPGLGQGAMIDPHGSLIGSMATMCITGFFDNLNRYKFIKCTYIDCLKNRVPKGTPILVCEQEYKYSSCVYNAGQMINMIPYANILRGVGGQIGGILQHPTSLLLGTVWQKRCSENVDQSTMCKTLKGLKTVAEMKRELDAAKDSQTWNKYMDKVCKAAGVD